MRNNSKGKSNGKRNWNGSKPSKSNPKSKGKEIEMDVEEGKINKADFPHVITSTKSNNDPQWYRNIPNLTADVATVPMSLPDGVLTQPTKVNSPVKTDPTSYAYPGIMTISLIPTIGQSKDRTSAANIAAQQFYTLTRKANSGAVNYDKTDLMMLILGMDSAYMLYEHLLRWYRTIGTYNYMNRYMPNDLLRALGASPELGKNLADFRGVLDLFAYQLASINIPDQFDIVKRHSWLFTNVYTDASDQKAQLYAYVPSGLYVWQEGVDGQPTKLKFMRMHELFGLDSMYAPVTTLDQIRHAIDTVMNPLLGSQDVGIMSGDLAKAFGESGMIKIQPVASHEALVPVYDPEVLLQMSNSHKCVNSWNASTLDIVADNSDLVSGPIIVQNLSDLYPNSKTENCIKPVLNFIDTDASPDNIMVATRLTTDAEYDAQGNVINVVYGTEVVETYTIWTAYNQDGKRVLNNMMCTGDVIHLASDSNIKTVLERFGYFTKFDWAPPQYFTWGAGAEETYIGNLMDICNYTFLEYTNLRDLHSVAVMSLFAVKDYNYTVK